MKKVQLQQSLGMELQFIPKSNFISVEIIILAGGSRTELQDFISKYLFVSSIPSILLQGKITGQDLIGSVNIEYNFDLPTEPGGNSTKVIKCIELVSMSYSVLDIIDPWRTCHLDCLVDAYFHNPLPFEMELVNLTYVVTFNDTIGFLCVLGECIYPPEDDIYFATVLEPGPIPPDQNALPLILPASQTGITAIRMDGVSNELCFRLYNDYNSYVLAIDIRDGMCAIAVGNFTVIISFNWFGYPILPNAPSCS